MANFKDLEEEIKSQDPNWKSGTVHDLHQDYGAEVIKANQVTPKSQPWFWHGIIPMDTSTLFAGLGNSGKSQLLIFLAAHTTTGIPFVGAGSAHQLPQGGVIILSGEDDFEYQLVPRLMAAEADLSKTYLLKMMKEPNKPKSLLDLDSHLNLLIDTIKQAEREGNPIKLIIVDPVQYFTGEMKDYINANVCRFIASLNDLAKEFNLSIIMNKHLRKKGGGDGASSAADSVAGSVAWTTSPRSCWLIHRHPEKEGVIVFADLKGNLKKKSSQSPAYIIEEAYIDNPNQNGQKIQTTKLIWKAELEDISADDALNSRIIPPIEKAIRDWIIKFLLECYKKPNNGGMFESAGLYKEAINNGFKRKSYYKAKANMLEDGIIKESVEGNAKKVLMIVLSDPETYDE